MAPTLPDKMRSFFGKKRPLANPDSLESAPSKEELSSPPDAPLKIDRKKAEEACRFVEERFKSAETHRKRFEGQWALALAYHEGRQWLDWSHEKGLYDIRSKDDLRWYRTTNLIRPLGRVATARITSNRPDVLILPRSDKELDQEAAEESRLVVEHYNTIHQDRLMWQWLLTYAWMASTAFLSIYWDPQAQVDVATEWDESGAPTKYEKRQAGDVVETVVPGHDVYLDPRARRFSECKWVIHAQQMTLEEISERWGVPVSANQDRTMFQSLISQIASPWATQEKHRVALVKTLYERPTERYPEGRTIVVAAGETLEYREGLPCGEIPLIPVGAAHSVGSPYHSGIGLDLISPQYDYNLLRSQWFGSLRAQKLTLVRQKGDGSGADVDDAISEDADGVDETPKVRTIWYRRGATPPTFTLPPPLPASDFTTAMREIRQEMSEIANVHRVSSGAGDPNAKSGISIRLLKDSDESAGAEFSHEFEIFLEERARRLILLCSKYVAEPRAWDLDDRNNSETQELVYSDLGALRTGGLAAVKVIEGSATPRTPEAEDQQVLDMLAQGLLGDPMAPETRELVLSVLHSPLAARVKEAVEKSQQEALERQAVTAQVEDQLDPMEEDPALGGMMPNPGLASFAPPTPTAPLNTPMGSGV